jgi:hypothetical protein
MDWLCLPAGAATWETRGHIDRYIGLDRPWLAVDTTNGPHRGRLYCAGTIGPPLFITSPDGGRTFQFPKVPHSIEYGSGPAQPVVLSDGSALAAYRSNRKVAGSTDPEHYQTFLSSDGGQSLTAGPFVTNWKHPHLRRRPAWANIQGGCPQMAVDPGSPRFADHLYIVWAQHFENRSNTEWILFSRSTDRGKSWSAPVNLSEQPDSDTDDPKRDYVAYIPCIAVNKDGNVAVTWYDRRGLSPPDSGGSMKGWNLRMRVSLDGGATWAPSVPVTSKPSSGDLTGWHTAGLAADAAGQFHPAWIDDRTGRPQLWTATVAVKEVR